MNLLTWIMFFLAVLAASADIFTTRLAESVGGRETNKFLARADGRMSMPKALIVKILATAFALAFHWYEPLAAIAFLFILILVQIVAASVNYSTYRS